MATNHLQIRIQVLSMPYTHVKCK